MKYDDDKWAPSRIPMRDVRIPDTFSAFACAGPVRSPEEVAHSQVTCECGWVGTLSEIRMPGDLDPKAYNTRNNSGRTRGELAEDDAGCPGCGSGEGLRVA